MKEILKVEKLKTQFKTFQGIVKAVDNISYHINESEIVGIVGESGCGKSVSQLSVLQVIRPPGEIVNGKVIFEGVDLLKFKPDSSEMRSIRGGKISMIFQEPMSALNPVLTIEQQMTEMIELHLGMGHELARKRSIELLKMVGIPEAESRINSYPHQFSGGMRQRVVIAMAISCNPKIIIADEPTTAVDVTTQLQLMELLQDMVDHINASLVIVTHNLGLIARYAQRIYVMYAGRIVETGTLFEVFGKPSHPYTIGLLECVPRLNKPKEKELATIRGIPPNLIDMPPTCAFLPRCSHSNEKCRKEPAPELSHINGQHYSACYVLP